MNGYIIHGTSTWDRHERAARRRRIIARLVLAFFPGFKA